MTQACLVLAAHPDDEVLGCGGTIARLASEGVDVHIVFFTDGIGARLAEPSPLSEADASARREAAEKARKILGARSVEFGDFPDNRMDSVALLDVVKVIDSAISRRAPGTVLSHHSGDVNVDHGVVHRATLAACRPQPGHPVHTLLFYEVASSTEWQTPGSGSSFTPTWFVDITPQMAKRTKALEAYSMEMRDWPHARSYQAVEHLARWRGATVGVEAAEAFMLGRQILRR